MTTLGADLRGWFPFRNRSAPPPVPSTTVPVLAYSLRKVVGGYSGACLRAMKTPGGSEQDIGFDAQGQMDETAFGSFVGSGDAFVRRWYNQGSAGTDGDMLAQSAFLPLLKLGANRFRFGPFQRPAVDPNDGPMDLANSAVARFASASMTVMAVIVPSASSTIPEHVIGFLNHWSVRAIPTQRSSFRYKDAAGTIRQTSGDANQMASGTPTRFAWIVTSSGTTVNLVRRIIGKRDTYSFPGGWGSYGSDGCQMFGRGASSLYTGYAAEVLVFSPALTEQQVADIEAGQISYYGLA